MHFDLLAIAGSQSSLAHRTGQDALAADLPLTGYHAQ
jgi:hypothetical protein